MTCKSSNFKLINIFSSNIYNIILNRKFPETDNEKLIVHMGLTENFLIMLDAGGKIKFFHL